VAFVLIGAAWIVKNTLVETHFLTGWFFFVTIIFLAAYNLRKAFPFLPLGTSAQWLQVHIYAGLLSFVLFLIHIDYELPNGFLESFLASVYLVVFGSGLVGLYMSRTFPKRLTDLGEEVIFEQIPVVRNNIQTDVEDAILECTEEIHNSEIPMFYRNEIYPFIMRRPDRWSHFVYGYSRYWRPLQKKLSDAKRLFDEEELNALAKVEIRLSRKHQLDTQETLQFALKVWLFIHIPATYSLLTFTALHVVLVQVWSGGAL
jgi:hypothetical protein